MSKFKVLKIEPVLQGFAELRNDPALVDMMEGLAESVRAATGDPEEYDITVRSGGGRRRANIKIGTASFKAMQQNMKRNTLLTALGSVGPYKLKK